MKLDVLEVIDQDDGTARVVIDMDYETIIVFAKIGLLHAITEAAERTIKYHEAINTNQDQSE